jgi:cell division protein FtsI/penicillin-binding protein 2
MRLITVILVIFLVPILGRLVWLQVIARAEWKEENDLLLDRPYGLPAPPPGVIMDRNGDLLVGNSPTYVVGAEVALVGDALAAAQELAPLLGRDVAGLQADLSVTDRRWVRLAWAVSGEAGKRLEDIKADKWYWLTLEPTWERYYAEGDLASHTIGFSNDAGYGYGVEAFHHRLIKPQPAMAQGSVDAASEPFPDELAQGKLRAFAGTDLRLTIDRTIQAFVQGELSRALAEYGAYGGTILVMNPRTGEILAVASSPAYDPARQSQYPESQRNLFVDPSISVPYEPGSVFKVITAAAAVDSGRIGRDWSYFDSGVLEYGGVVIRNSDRQAHGTQDLQGLLSSSLNVGAATLTTQVLGADLFYRYVRAFGFGQLTGVDLTAEVAGFVHLPTDWDWTDSTLATNSFGQGIAVTPLQMVTAVSALANHGTMMAPYVVAERRYPDGSVVPTTPRALGQPISRETADYIAELMGHNVADRYDKARVPGYGMAGKSGTAQIPVSGGYDPVEVVTSFIGFGPLPEPEFVILVKLDRPQIEPYLRWGTQTAAPVFQSVAARLFVLLGIAPTEAVGEQ